MKKLIKKHQAGSKLSIGDEVTDTGTRLLHAVSSFGGSVIGDAIAGISPTAAKMVQKYTAGMIPYTTKEQLETNRSANPNRWINRTGQTANAISNVAVGEMTGAVMQKAAPLIVNTALNLEKGNLKTLIYNNITPASYTNKGPEIKGLMKDIINTKYPQLIDNPVRRDIGIEGYKLPEHIIMKNREDAWKLYLGVGDKGESLYNKNYDGTYFYNNNRITARARNNFLNQNFNNATDLLTSNGGGIGEIKVIPSNYSDVSFAKMTDVWDLQPFKNANRSLITDSPVLRKLLLKPISIADKTNYINSGIMNRSYRNWVPEKFKNMEIGEALGVGKPFTVEHSVPYKTIVNTLDGPDDLTSRYFRNKYINDRTLYEKPELNPYLSDYNIKPIDFDFAIKKLVNKNQNK